MESFEQTLLRIARESIRYELETGQAYHPPRELDPLLLEFRATFVTLHTGKHLRGCMGSIEPTTSLAEDVARNAANSAFRDPRFSPLKKDELNELRISISILSPLEKMDAKNKEELIRSIRPGIDGLLLIDGHHRSTFLPSVWEHITNPNEFVTRLMRKGGIPVDSQMENGEFYRYFAQYIEE